MKLLIIGDTHGNISNITHVMRFAKRIKAFGVIHTGDWNNLKSLETVINFNIPLYAVSGNADIDPKLLGKLKILSKKYDEKILKLRIDGLRIAVTHNIKKTKLNTLDFDFVFCGHRHMQNKNGNIINPGALENDINFAVFDTKTKVVEFISHDQI